MSLPLLTACLALAAPPGRAWRADFEAGVGPGWRVLAGAPRTVGVPGGRALEMTPGSIALLEGAGERADVAVVARVRFAERMGWIEAPFLLRASPSGDEAIQFYLEQKSGEALVTRMSSGGWTPLARAPSPSPLVLGTWYRVKVVAVGGRVAAWVNGRLAVATLDERPRAGLVGLRVGQARTQYDDLTVRPPTREEVKTMQGLPLGARSRPRTIEVEWPAVGGGHALLLHPDVAEPTVPFAVRVSGRVRGPVAVRIGGARLRVRPGVPAQVTLGGRQGARTVEVWQGRRRVAVSAIQVRAVTHFDAGPYAPLFERLERTVRADRSTHRYLGRAIRCNPTWVRDHIHEMKAYQFWETDLASFVDALLDLQQPDGSFFEILTSPEDAHLTFVDEKHRRIDRGDNIGWVRLEMEADVEYLMVEGAFRIWQATGDLEALRRRLPRLERGLLYCFTDPTRWDAEHGALKRTFSIDTWDFTYGCSERNRRIEPGMPMGIMHGDNSGLYQASRQLAAMLRAAGDGARARAWDERADGLRERVNRLCFNGRYYTHQVLLQPVDTGVEEEEILSLSNAYDINRGLPTRPMAVRILDEYARRRTLRAGTHFAEWFSIDPPYPRFGPHPAGQYINGGIASFVAGELAKAALEHGREAYGADLLRRLAEKVEKDGAIYFLYTADGRDQGGGPSGWGAAAVISALIEGLAGIRDDDRLFRSVTVSPRFCAAGIDRASVCARYGPSGAYVALRYEHDAARRAIRLVLAGAPRSLRLRVLLPAGAATATVDGKRARIEKVEDAHYALVEPPRGPGDGTLTIEVAYR